MGFIRKILIMLIVILAGWLAVLYVLDRSGSETANGAAPSAADQSTSAPAPAEEQSASLAPSESTASTAPQPAQPAASAPSGDVGNAANANLHINDAGLAIIEESEGLRLEAYSGAGGWYIGYGHSGAQPGQKISEAEAVRLLKEDVKGAEDYVRRLVTVPLNVNEFSALVSYCFNVGGGNFGKSDILELVNAGKLQAAADAFLTHNKAGGKVLDHLTKRRQEERALFLTPA